MTLLLIPGDGILSSQMQDDVLISMAEAYLISPKLKLSSPKCLTFHYYNQARLQVLLSYDRTKVGSLIFLRLDGGKSWHFYPLSLPAGSYAIKFLSNGVEEHPPSIGPPHEVSLSAINDVILHDTSCQNLTGM